MRDGLRRFGAWAARPLGLTVARTADVEADAAERERLARRLARERAKVARLKDRLSASQEDRAALSGRIGELDAAVLEREAEIGKLGAQARELLTQRKALTRRLDRAAADGAELLRQRDWLAARLDRVGAQAGELYCERKALARELRRANANLDQLSAGRAELEARLQDESAKAGAVFHEHKKLARRFARMAAQASDLFRRDKAAAKHLERLREQLAQTVRERDASRTEVFLLSKRLARMTDPPESSPLAGKALAEAAARARRRVQGRAAVLDERKRTADYPQTGRLSVSWPTLAPAPAAESSRSWAPLRIAIVGESRSSFLKFADPRVLARQLGDPAVADPDVLVFPRSDVDDYVSTGGLVPDRIWRRARQGRTTVVFDCSIEGMPHKEFASNLMHSFLADRSIDPAGAAYMTQARHYRPDYEAWCARVGATPMRVVVFDAFIHRTLERFARNGDWVFQNRLAAFQDRGAERSRRFISLNFTPRPPKVLFLLRLLRDNLWDKGWISFGGFSSEEGADKQSRAGIVDGLLALEGFLDDVDSALPFIGALDDMGPVLFDAPGVGRELDRSRAILANELGEYADSWFSVVTETEMLPRPHRITEKPFKALLNFHPFLLLGNPGSLELLRAYGFETFSEIFDERYDAEPDPRRRFDMVYEQVRRLCSMDEAELARMTERAAEILTFNACWGLTELPRRFNELIGTEIVGQLAPRARALRARSRQSGA